MCTYDVIHIVTFLCPLKTVRKTFFLHSEQTDCNNKILYDKTYIYPFLGLT